jgi:hypothetical protein
MVPSVIAVPSGVVRVRGWLPPCLTPAPVVYGQTSGAAGKSPLRRNSPKVAPGHGVRSRIGAAAENPSVLFGLRGRGGGSPEERFGRGSVREAAGKTQKKNSWDSSDSLLLTVGAEENNAIRLSARYDIV